MGTALLIGAALAGCEPATDAGAAVTVEDAYAMSPAADGPAAMFLTLANAGATADTLVRVEVSGVAEASLHDQNFEGGLVTMVPVPHIVIPAGGELRMQPGALHVMLVGVSAGMAEGDSLDARIELRGAGTIERRVPVVAFPGPAGGADHSAHSSHPPRR